MHHGEAVDQCCERRCGRWQRRSHYQRTRRHLPSRLPPPAVQRRQQASMPAMGIVQIGSCSGNIGRTAAPQCTESTPRRCPAAPVKTCPVPFPPSCSKLLDQQRPHLSGCSAAGASAAAANAAKYSGWARCLAGACAARSPTTTSPLAATKAAKAAGTAASGASCRASRPRTCKPRNIESQAVGDEPDVS